MSYISKHHISHEYIVYHRLTSEQRLGVESCIKTLAEVAKSRGIAIPSELDIQVATMFSKVQYISLRLYIIYYNNIS